MLPSASGSTQLPSRATTLPRGPASPLSLLSLTPLSNCTRQPSSARRSRQECAKTASDLPGITNKASPPAQKQRRVNLDELRGNTPPRRATRGVAPPASRRGSGLLEAASRSPTFTPAGPTDRASSPSHSTLGYGDSPTPTDKVTTPKKSSTTTPIAAVPPPVLPMEEANAERMKLPTLQRSQQFPTRPPSDGEVSEFNYILSGLLYSSIEDATVSYGGALPSSMNPRSSPSAAATTAAPVPPPTEELHQRAPVASIGGRVPTPRPVAALVAPQGSRPTPMSVRMNGRGYTPLVDDDVVRYGDDEDDSHEIADVSNGDTAVTRESDDDVVVADEESRVRADAGGGAESDEEDDEGGESAERKVKARFYGRATTAENHNGARFLNDYLIIQDVGRGATSKVQLAYSLANNQKVAIKIIHRRKEKYRLVKSASIMAEEAAEGGGDVRPVAPSAAERQQQALQREIDVMKQLHHPNIVSLYEVINDPQSNKIYIIMQYIDQGPIATIDSEGRASRTLSSAELVKVANQVCAGLRYLHRGGVVHRDIKPENILVDSGSRAFLADFGVAEMFKDEDAKATTVGNCGFQGTPLFMAPEIYAVDTDPPADERYDEDVGRPEHSPSPPPAGNRTAITPARRHPSPAHSPSRSSAGQRAIDPFALDIWALGVTFMTLLTGRVPFTSIGQIRATVTEGVKFPPSVPPEWRPVLQAMLESDHTQRIKIRGVQRLVKEMGESQKNERELESVALTENTDAVVRTAEHSPAFHPLDCHFYPTDGDDEVDALKATVTTARSGDLLASLSNRALETTTTTLRSPTSIMTATMATPGTPFLKGQPPFSVPSTISQNTLNPMRKSGLTTEGGKHSRGHSRFGLSLTGVSSPSQQPLRYKSPINLPSMDRSTFAPGTMPVPALIDGAAGRGSIRSAGAKASLFKGAVLEKLGP